LPDPLVVALAINPGGSDCAYRSALFGEVQGRITQLTPELQDHYTRGGDFLTKDASENWKLTVYSERYQPNDVHVNGPSRMAVFDYTYDTSRHRFVQSGHGETNYSDIYANANNLLRIFGDFATC